MKSMIGATLLSLSLGVTATASASERTVAIEFTNLTNGTYFTPLLFAAHDAELHLFRVGEPASESLQAMAEGGALAGLVAQVTAAEGNFVENPAGGLLAPGESVTTMLQVEHHNRHLSATAMLLPTNDGFVGLDGMSIPRRPGVYTVYLNGYDAGTEANDELITGGGDPGVPGIPADPGGNNGMNGTGVSGPDYNGMVHVHRGVLGDLDPSGGVSDLDASVHHWLNPVAKLTVTVQ